MAGAEHLTIGADRDPAARDRFVLDHPRHTPFHLSAWGAAVERTFGPHPRDLVARAGSEIMGVLPLGLCRGITGGARLVASPYAVYGGPLAVSREVEIALLQAAASRADAAPVRHLEIRFRDPAPVDWPTGRACATFRGPIAEGAEENLAAIPKETRRMVRRSLEQGFVPTADWRHLDAFYALLSRSYRDHGTPVFPRRWFLSLRREYGQRCVLFSLTDGATGPVVASVLTFLTGGEVSPYYVGVRRDLHSRGVNHALYFLLMRWARARGFDRFDFGRSKLGSGSYRFKRTWGFTESPLDYRYHLVADRAVPDLSPQNPRLGRLIDAWRHLPLPLADRLGPLISPRLG